VTVYQSRRTSLGVIAGVSVLATLTACGNGDPGVSGAAGSPITVEATDTACTVSANTANAGNVTFQINNKGTKITEFYVYADGDKIMGEAENIAPGLNSRLIVGLPNAGRYQATCKPGMTGDGIRSDITVTGGEAKQAGTSALDAQAAKSYTDYVSNNATELEGETGKFVAAVKAGRIDEAKALYTSSRIYYERIEPVAESFGDLDPLIDAREADLAPGEQFTGFHRLEKDLWATGLQPDSSQIADKLLADVTELAAKSKALPLTALDLANGAKGLMDEVATRKITGEEETYSHTDLSDFQSNLDGSKAAINSLRPVLQEKNSAILSTLDKEFGDVQALLSKQATGDGFKPYTALSQDQIKEFASAVDALSEPLSKVAEVVAQ
jgi:iron uptake system component EfeO